MNLAQSSNVRYNISLAEFFRRKQNANDTDISCTLKEEGIQGVKHGPISTAGFYLVQRPTKLTNKRIFSIFYQKVLSNPTDTIVHYGPFANLLDLEDFAKWIGKEIVEYE